MNNSEYLSQTLEFSCLLSLQCIRKCSLSYISGILIFSFHKICSKDFFHILHNDVGQEANQNWVVTFSEQILFRANKPVLPQYGPKNVSL